MVGSHNSCARIDVRLKNSGQDWLNIVLSDILAANFEIEKRSIVCQPESIFR